MPASSPRRSFLSRRFGRFLRAQQGVVSVEFGLIAPIFILTVLGIIGMGLLVFEQAALDRATIDAARLIRTGQVQAAGGAESVFTGRLCSDLGGLIPCSALEVNVQAASDFAALSAAVPLTSSGTMQDTGFVPGGPGQSVLVQVGYRAGFPFSLIAPMVGGGSGILLVSSVAFQNEQY
jgi:Flp pilus assembly protein TadG